MSYQSALSQLSKLDLSQGLIPQFDDLTEMWSRTENDVGTVEAVFRFMEEHPSLEYGTPGPLVHFVERFSDADYESKLSESISRQPTFQTIWMLNRVINGKKDPLAKRSFVDMLSRARNHPLIDSRTASRIDHFLKLHNPK